MTDDEKRWTSQFADLGWVLRAIRDARSRLDRVVASRFNLLQDVDLTENRISNILGDLLDPAGKHGQGDVFLRIFLERVKRSDKYQGKAAVFREEMTWSIAASTRRIDLMVDLDGKFGIAIENKPWAGEQSEQLEDYASEMETRYKDRDFLLLFLSGMHRKPESIIDKRRANLEAQGRFQIEDYGNWLVPLLRSFRNATLNDRVRSYIDDFQRILGARFGAVPEKRGEDVSDGPDPLVQFVLKDTERVRLAVEIISQAESLRLGLAREAAAAIAQGLLTLVTEGWSEAKGALLNTPFVQDASLQVSNEHFPVKLSLLCRASGGARMFFGVSYADGPYPKCQQPFRDALRTELETIRKGDAPTDWYPWLHGLDDGLSDWSHSTLLEMRERPDKIERLVNHMLAVAKTVESFFLANPQYTVRS